MKVLLFGGTGSLGKSLLKKLQNEYEICVFSRCEEKHVKIKQQYPQVRSIIGDVRDCDSVKRALSIIKPQIVINAAALKNVPECEYFPAEAMKTNTIGTLNIVNALESYNGTPIKSLFVSTDKCVKSVNAYGMSKALAERIHLTSQNCIANAVRYGNVLSSRGSVIPIFKKMVNEKRQLTVTQANMTRFFLSLDQAVDLITIALKDHTGGNVFVPKVPSAKIMDLARIMDPKRDPKISGIRPGEKIDEILISEEELVRTEERGDIFVIHDIKSDKRFFDLHTEYSSKSDLMTKDQLEEFLIKHGVFDE